MGEQKEASGKFSVPASQILACDISGFEILPGFTTCQLCNFEQVIQPL